MLWHYTCLGLKNITFWVILLINITTALLVLFMGISNVSEQVPTFDMMKYNCAETKACLWG